MFVCASGGGGNLFTRKFIVFFLIFLKFVLLSKRAAVGFYCVLAIVWVSVLECLFLGM